jgi:hypothetical protein
MAKITVIPKTADAHVARGELTPLSDLAGYMVSDPSPDIRGWPVKLSDHRTAGKVDDLIVDTNDLVVKYVEIELAREFRHGHEDEWLLIPTSAIRPDEAHATVIIDRLPAEGLAKVPRSRRGAAARRAPTVAEAVATAELFETSVPESNPIIEEVVENRPLQID